MFPLVEFTEFSLLMHPSSSGLASCSSSFVVTPSCLLIVLSLVPGFSTLMVSHMLEQSSIACKLSLSYCLILVFTFHLIVSGFDSPSRVSRCPAVCFY